MGAIITSAAGGGCGGVGSARSDASTPVTDGCRAATDPALRRMSRVQRRASSRAARRPGGSGPVTLRCDFMSVPSQRNETRPRGHTRRCDRRSLVKCGLPSARGGHDHVRVAAGCAGIQTKSAAAGPKNAAPASCISRAAARVRRRSGRRPATMRDRVYRAAAA